MIPLALKTNVLPPDASFPFGRIKDNPGDNSGTPVNEAVYGDIHQFFAKLFAESGIMANNFPDSEDDGFQLYEALKKVIDHSEWTTVPFSGLFTAFNADGNFTLYDPDTVVSFMINGGTLFYKISLTATVVDDGSINDGAHMDVEFGFTIRPEYVTSETSDSVGDVGFVYVSGGARNQGFASTSTDATNNLVVRGQILNRNVVNGNTVVFKVAGSWPLA